jgi:hypothetical protein
MHGTRRPDLLTMTWRRQHLWDATDERRPVLLTKDTAPNPSQGVGMRSTRGTILSCTLVRIFLILQGTKQKLQHGHRNTPRHCTLQAEGLPLGGILSR